MKERITFKTPDAVHYATEHLNADARKEVEHVAAQFIRYGEILVVEIDTEKETCTVVKP